MTPWFVEFQPGLGENYWLKPSGITCEIVLLLVPPRRTAKQNATMLNVRLPHPRWSMRPGRACLSRNTTELGNLIRCADLAFGGKTLPSNQGGQNPIDPSLESRWYWVRTSRISVRLVEISRPPGH